MPIYEYGCPGCKLTIERVGQIEEKAPECLVCGIDMVKRPTYPALIKIKGQGYPSRRRWAQNWTPASPKFSTGSLHGERY